ncbi:hypothetical protein T484DRAFT_1865783, partial [Baffinella frigidus]
MDAAERRSKFSRRRPEIVEAAVLQVLAQAPRDRPGRRPEIVKADVDYINDRNKHFNKKIERAFGEYTK